MNSAPGNPEINRHETVMADPERLAAVDRGPGLVGRFLGRRRNYLIDSGYQVRTAVVAVLGMIFLLAFAAALFHLAGLENSLALAQKNQAPPGDVRTVLYLVAAGIIFVAAVFMIEILETHKTAGVIFKVTRALHAIESGHWGTRVALRKNDNFKELEEAFNDVGRSLQDRVEEDLHELQGIEGRIRLAAREFESDNREGAMVLMRRIASEVQRLRERRRNLMRAADGDPFPGKSS